MYFFIKSAKFLFYNVFKKNMFTIETEDGRGKVVKYIDIYFRIGAVKMVPN